MPTRSSALTIAVGQNFDLAATVQFLRFTDAEIVDTFEQGSFRRLFLLPSAERGTSPHVVTVTQSRAESLLHVTLTPNADEATNAHVVSLVEGMFSVKHDLRGFRRLIKSDPVLSRIESAHRGLHLPCWASLFEALTISILAQQISITVAYVLKRRFVERLGERVQTDERTFYAFPTPARVAAAEQDELRALGLSNAKARGIIELARFIAGSPHIADELATEDNAHVIERLSSLRGIGRWTAEWALMLYFGRTDVFPAGDLALRAIGSKYYFNSEPVTERALREFALARWGAWASYVCIYLFAGLRAKEINLDKPAQARQTKQARRT